MKRIEFTNRDRKEIIVVNVETLKSLRIDEGYYGEDTGHHYSVFINNTNFNVSIPMVANDDDIVDFKNHIINFCEDETKHLLELKETNINDKRTGFYFFEDGKYVGGITVK